MTFDGLYSYAWDAENHLKSANGVNYTYDGGLRRVKKSNGKLYWYSISGQILEETDLSGNLISDYVYLGGKLVWRRDASGSVYFYFTDPLGTVRGIYTSGSSLCYDADFYPFGGEKVHTNTCAQNYKFTGLERDAESGLDKTPNRMYSSNMGRWLSRDPLGGTILNPQSLNRYGYVLNNPTSLIDRSGLDSSYSDTVSIDPNDPLSGLYTLVTVNGSLGAPSGGGTAGALVHAPLLDDGGGVGGCGGRGGGGVHKHFGGTFPCNRTASSVMKAIEGNFSQFGNFKGSFGPLGVPVNTADVTFGAGPITLGATVSIHDVNQIPLPPGIVQTINVSVTVGAVSATSFTFDTNLGHVLFPATITFSATDAGAGQISFSIDVNGDFASDLSKAGYYAAGYDLENGIWNNFVKNVKALCGNQK